MYKTLRQSLVRHDARTKRADGAGIPVLTPAPSSSVAWAAVGKGVAPRLGDFRRTEHALGATGHSGVDVARYGRLFLNSHITQSDAKWACASWPPSWVPTPPACTATSATAPS